MCCLLTMFNVVQSYSNHILLTFVFRHDLFCRQRSDDDAEGDDEPREALHDLGPETAQRAAGDGAPRALGRRDHRELQARDWEIRWCFKMCFVDSGEMCSKCIENAKFDRVFSGAPHPQASVGAL